MQRIACVPIAFAILLAGSAPARAQTAEDETQARAAELVKRLATGDSQVVAAAMPDDPSRFVAALHIPGVQLLVISAVYPSPPLLRELLMKRDDRRVYTDLNSAAVREGRFFVEDMSADGLRAQRKPGQPFDITWRDGTLRTLYNGDWKSQELSQAEYRDRFAKDTTDYARILQVLLDAYAARQTMQR